MSIRHDHILTPFLMTLVLAGSGAASEWSGKKLYATPKKTIDSNMLCDLRLGISTVPGIENIDVASSTWGGNFSTDAKMSLGFVPSFTLGGFWRNGLGLGIEVGVPWRKSVGTASNGDRFEVAAYGLELAPVFAFRINPRLHLECGVPFSAGFANHEMPGFDTNRAEWWSTGVRLGAYWTWVNGLQMGGEMGWLTMSTLGRVKDSGGSMDVDYHSRGPTIGITFGHRF